MARPRDAALYEKVKKQLYREVPTHSAYRSGLLVQRYKSAYRKKYGIGADPYIGEKPKASGLARWFDEDWRTQEGSKTYKRRGDIFRPTKRISKETPTTLGELSPQRVRRAVKEKRRTGRVGKY